MLIEIANKEEFDRLIKENENVILDFWAPWCGPCKIVIPTLEDLSEEYKDKVVFAKVNVDENSDLAQSFGIRSIPTVIFIKNEEKKDQVIGASPKKFYTERISKHFLSY